MLNSLIMKIRPKKIFAKRRLYRFSLAVVFIRTVNFVLKSSMPNHEIGPLLPLLQPSRRGGIPNERNCVLVWKAIVWKGNSLAFGPCLFSAILAASWINFFTTGHFSVRRVQPSVDKIQLKERSALCWSGIFAQSLGSCSEYLWSVT